MRKNNTFLAHYLALRAVSQTANEWSVSPWNVVKAWKSILPPCLNLTPWKDDDSNMHLQEKQHLFGSLSGFESGFTNRKWMECITLKCSESMKIHPSSMSESNTVKRWWLKHALANLHLCFCGGLCIGRLCTSDVLSVIITVRIFLI